MKVILTGASGMVGEGVLLECLANPAVTQVLMVNRKHVERTHPKLRELIVPDFMNPDAFSNELSGYDACFYCAGISAVGLNEAQYTKITYDTPLRFAEKLLSLNPDMVFNHVSGSHTDSSEKGRVMWARVKGRAENALMRMPFKKVYNFRPSIMEPVEGQRNIKSFYKVIVIMMPLFKLLFAKQMLNISQVGRAMIHAVQKGYSKQVLEVADIRELAKG
ncbi:MAG: NAD-dependent epimerase/dehydratase family protein [Bacteroidota bacterium]